MKSTMVKEEKEKVEVGMLMEYVGIYHNTDKFIILLTGSNSYNFKGVIIWSDSLKRQVGYYGNDWAKHSFEPFNGKITLEQ